MSESTIVHIPRNSIGFLEHEVCPGESCTVDRVAYAHFTMVVVDGKTTYTYMDDGEEVNRKLPKPTAYDG